MTGKSSSTYVGRIQGETLKRIYLNHHRTFDCFSVIHNAYNHKYDYTTKPQAVIQNCFRKQLHSKKTKHCYKSRCNK